MGDEGYDAPDFDSDAPDRDRGGVGDSLRRLFVTGMSAVFMTEEGIRNVLSEVRLPKEALSALLQQTERSRRELIRMLSDELKRYLRALDVPGELRKALTGLTLEIDARVRIVDEEGQEKQVIHSRKSRRPSRKSKSE